jgi:hypothetical protein
MDIVVGSHTAGSAIRNLLNSLECHKGERVARMMKRRVKRGCSATWNDSELVIDEQRHKSGATRFKEYVPRLAKLYSWKNNFSCDTS